MVDYDWIGNNLWRGRSKASRSAGLTGRHALMPCMPGGAANRFDTYIYDTYI